MFLGLTAGMETRHRREVAVRGPAIAFVILVAVGLVGARVLALLGTRSRRSVSRAACSCGPRGRWCSTGVASGWRRPPTAPSPSTMSRTWRCSPAIPLIAGLGATATSCSQAVPRPRHRLLAGLAATSQGCSPGWVILAERTSRFLCRHGRGEHLHVLGIILAAMAVQFVIDGVETVSPAERSV
ncbi:MAG: MarC family protein [Chloroflexota bacterium]